MIRDDGYLLPVTYYIERFEWPQKADGEMKEPRIYHFLTGHSPELAKKIEWYES